MSKQTAVEWLIERIEDVDLTPELFEEVKQKAKQREAEQKLASLNEAIKRLEQAAEKMTGTDKIYLAGPLAVLYAVKKETLATHEATNKPNQS